MEDKYLDIEEGNQTELVDGERETLNPIVNQEAKPIYVADPNRDDLETILLDVYGDGQPIEVQVSKDLLVPTFNKKNIEELCQEAINKAIAEGKIGQGGEVVEGGYTLKFLDFNDENFYIFSGKDNSLISGVSPFPSKDGKTAHGFTTLKGDKSTLVTFPIILTENETLYPIILDIPPEYKKVEYIQSTGAQYIDTNFYDTKGMECKIGFTYLGNYGSWNRLIGCEGGSSGNWNGNNIVIQTAGTNLQIRKGSGAISYYSASSNVYYDLELKSYFNGTHLTINDTPQSIENTDNVCPSLNFYVFASNQNGTPVDFGRYRLYYLKIYEEGVLVRDLVPCYRKADNKPGLYDVVNGVFYTNAGSDDFVVGGDVNA